jgi:hypothetical protein
MHTKIVDIMRDFYMMRISVSDAMIVIISEIWYYTDSSTIGIWL